MTIFAIVYICHTKIFYALERRENVQPEKILDRQDSNLFGDSWWIFFIELYFWTKIGSEISWSIITFYLPVHKFTVRINVW